MFDLVTTLRWQDFLDIGLVAFIIYQLISIIRGTRSVQMVVGLIILSLVYLLASSLDLAAMMWLMQTFLSSILLIVIIVFQQDIRRALTQMGKSPFQKSANVIEKDLDEIVRAAFYMSSRRIGALIVIERETWLGEYIESGFELDAVISKDLIISIFMPVSPLHDGGIVIKNSRIDTAGCILPLIQNPYIDKKYGTRHRAALGLSEESDAVIIVVSEETQEVSLVQHGAISTVKEVALEKSLKAIFVTGGKRKSIWKDWYKR
ncbi:MAG: TIGR00159 family protein [Deltaproteobacteria bacterium]|nr:MAG: TIGR00159 family protein [Deltaproteobacteria bacterium]